MGELQVVLELLALVAVLALIADRLKIPYPIALVLGGLGIALVPHVPTFTLEPDVVFLIFLPPLVYRAGFGTSLRDFRASLGTIGGLSVGLVLATMAGVAVVSNLMIPALGWGTAFVLGAVVSPTDTLAPAAIFARLGAPRKVRTVLEGESLVNDATGLIAFRFALAAVATGTFSMAQAGLGFVVDSVGAIVLGLVVAWLINQIQRHLEDPPVEITLSVLAPYAVYLLADRLTLSGVLAVAAAGIYAGRANPRTWSAATRLQALGLWEVVTFVLNGLAFILIGLQLPTVISALGGSAVEAAAYGAVISLVVIVIRLAWVFAYVYVGHLFGNDLRARWRRTIIVAWTGMRGAISLAAALSIPLAVGRARDVIIVATFAVILVTLVGQGLTLAPLMRLLGVGGGREDAEEALEARTQAIQAALARLDEIAKDEPDWAHGVEPTRRYYEKRLQQLHLWSAGADHPEEERARHREHAEGVMRLREELLNTERAVLVELRDRGVIGDAALRRVQRDLDLEELRLGAPGT